MISWSPNGLTTVLDVGEPIEVVGLLPTPAIAEWSGYCTLVALWRIALTHEKIEAGFD